MNTRIRLALAFLSLLLSASPASLAGGEKESPFSLELRTGLEYDSNVAVLDLDSSSGEGDLAAVVDLGLGFDRDLTPRWSLGLGYDFSQSLHDEFDAFDIRIHRGSAEVGRDFGTLDAGLTFQYADAALDGNGFLVLKRTSPYVSKLFGKRVFVRLAYSRSDKEFDTSPGRDARTDSGSADVFVFWNGVKSYLALGYQRRDEDAVDAQFDYRGRKIKAQLSRRIVRGARTVRIKTELRHDAADYRAPFSLIGAPRQDDRYRFEVEVETSLRKRGFLRARYEYGDNRSNLASVNFDEHVASVAVGVKL